MRYASCYRIVGIVDFDEHCLVRLLPVLEEPPVSRIRQHSKKFFLVVRVNDVGWDEVSVRHAVGVSYGQWVLIYGLNRPPDLVCERLAGRLK